LPKSTFGVTTTGFVPIPESATRFGDSDVLLTIDSVPVEIAAFEHQISALCCLQFGIRTVLPDQQVPSPPDVEVRNSHH
jgi:hypothetical protein